MHKGGGIAPCAFNGFLIYYTPVKRDMVRMVRNDRKAQQPKGDKDMERYDYEEAMRNDIREYLDENWEKGKRIEDEDRDKLHEDMWLSDSVTGNGSGSYTFSPFKAEENVCHNLDLLVEALAEFCVDISTLAEKLDGEWADVTIRCMMLGRIEGEIFDEWNAKIDEEKESEDELEEDA